MSGNFEAVYFCIIEGINPNLAISIEENKNVFIYACEKN